MRLPKHTTLKAALLTLAAAASLGAHAATVQDEAIAFATNNPMSLTVQGDDIAVNLTTNTALQPGAHVEQKSDKPCPVSLTTASNNGNETLTIKRVDNTQPCTAVVAVNLPEKSTLGVRQKTPLIYANGNFGKITTDGEHLTFTLQGRADSLELNAAGAVTSSIHVQQLPISLISIRARHMATSISLPKGATAAYEINAPFKVFEKGVPSANPGDTTIRLQGDTVVGSASNE